MREETRRFERPGNHWPGARLFPSLCFKVGLACQIEVQTGLEARGKLLVLWGLRQGEGLTGGGHGTPKIPGGGLSCGEGVEEIGHSAPIFLLEPEGNPEGFGGIPDFRSGVRGQEPGQIVGSEAIVGSEEEAVPIAGNRGGGIPWRKESGELEVGPAIVRVEPQGVFKVVPGLFRVAKPGLEEGHFMVGDRVPGFQLQVGLQFRLRVRQRLWARWRLASSLAAGA